jgi:hypothetical protein
VEQPGVMRQNWYYWRVDLIAIKLRIEYPISNTEYPISKWNSLEL